MAYNTTDLSGVARCLKLQWDMAIRISDFYEQNAQAYHRHLFGKQIEKKFHFTLTNKSHKIGAECVSIFVEYSFETIYKKF